MKAVVYTRYGGPEVLRLTDADTPVPADGQVLVQVHAVSVSASDWEGLRGKPLYALRRAVPGAAPRTGFGHRGTRGRVFQTLR